VFGTLKEWMGSTHFLTKTLPRVRTEMSRNISPGAPRNARVTLATAF
jgi:hypothetical protein